VSPKRRSLPGETYAPNEYGSPGSDQRTTGHPRAGRLHVSVRPVAFCRVRGWARTYESARTADGQRVGLRALVALSHGSAASSSAVQGQMPAEEARTRYDQVPGHRKLFADSVPAAQTCDE